MDHCKFWWIEIGVKSAGIHKETKIPGHPYFFENCWMGGQYFRIYKLVSAYLFM